MTEQLLTSPLKKSPSTKNIAKQLLNQQNHQPTSGGVLGSKGITIGSPKPLPLSPNMKIQDDLNEVMAILLELKSRSKGNFNSLSKLNDNLVVFNDKLESLNLNRDNGGDSEGDERGNDRLLEILIEKLDKLDKLDNFENNFKFEDNLIKLIVSQKDELKNCLLSNNLENNGKLLEFVERKLGENKNESAALYEKLNSIEDLLIDLRCQFEESNNNLVNATNTKDDCFTADNFSELKTLAVSQLEESANRHIRLNNTLNDSLKNEANLLSAQLHNIDINLQDNVNISNQRVANSLNELKTQLSTSNPVDGIADIFEKSKKDVVELVGSRLNESVKDIIDNVAKSQEQFRQSLSENISNASRDQIAKSQAIIIDTITESNHQNKGTAQQDLKTFIESENGKLADSLNNSLILRKLEELTLMNEQLTRQLNEQKLNNDVKQENELLRLENTELKMKLLNIKNNSNELSDLNTEINQLKNDKSKIKDKLISYNLIFKTLERKLNDLNHEKTSILNEISRIKESYEADLEKRKSTIKKLEINTRNNDKLGLIELMKLAGLNNATNGSNSKLSHNKNDENDKENKSILSAKRNFTNVI